MANHARVEYNKAHATQYVVMFCEFYVEKSFSPTFVNKIQLFLTTCPPICSRQVGMYGYVHCVQCSYTAWSILSLLRNDHLYVCATLIQANAEVNSRDRKRRYTSLHLASRYVVYAND